MVRKSSSDLLNSRGALDAVREQPRVLDRDHRLSGKISHKIDLLLRKRANLDHRPRQKNMVPIGIPSRMSEEDNRASGAKTAQPFVRRAEQIRASRRKKNVRHMDDFALQGGAKPLTEPRWTFKVQSLHIFEKIRRKSILRNVFNGVLVKERHIAFFRAAKAHRRLDQRIEHRL